MTKKIETTELNDAELDAVQGAGDSALAGLESSFGADFTSVRVHTDSKSTTDSIGAKAFTSSNNSAFGSTEPASDTTSLEHELKGYVEDDSSGT